MNPGDRGFTDADDFFRAKALELGWLSEDAHEPGNGRGLWAFYRDAGIQPPEVLERITPKRELTGFDGLDERSLGPRPDRRSTTNVVAE